MRFNELEPRAGSGMSDNLAAHFSMIDGFDDKPEENIEQTLLGVIGYARQTLHLHPGQEAKVMRYMASEYLRVKCR